MPGLKKNHFSFFVKESSGQGVNRCPGWGVREVLTAPVQKKGRVRGVGSSKAGRGHNPLPYRISELGGINQEWLGLGSLCLMTSGIQLKTAMGIDGMAVAKQ